MVETGCDWVVFWAALNQFSGYTRSAGLIGEPFEEHIRAVLMSSLSQTLCDYPSTPLMIHRNCRYIFALLVLLRKREVMFDETATY